MNFEKILADQRTFFNSQKTKSIKFRKMYLEKLRDLIIKNEELLYEAIYKDFGKSRFDTFTTEISFILKRHRFLPEKPQFPVEAKESKNQPCESTWDE